MQHVQLHRRHRVEVPQDHRLRHPVAHDVDHQPAPRIARPILDRHDGHADGAVGPLDELQDGLETAQDAEGRLRRQGELAGPHRYRVRLVLDGLLDGAGALRARHAERDPPAARARRAWPHLRELSPEPHERSGDARVGAPHADRGEAAAEIERSRAELRRHGQRHQGEARRGRWTGCAEACLPARPALPPRAARATASGRRRRRDCSGAHRIRDVERVERRATTEVRCASRRRTREGRSGTRRRTSSAARRR